MVTTERLELRPFELADAEALTAILSGEGVLDYFPPAARPPSLELSRRMIANIREQWEDHGYGLWAVNHIDSGDFLGRAGLQYLDETDEIEVDFLLDRRYWGQGLATEAGRASLAYGFGELAAEEIVGIVHPDNQGSRRVLEKIGMALDTRTEYFGMAVDRYVARPGQLNVAG